MGFPSKSMFSLEPQFSPTDMAWRTVQQTGDIPPGKALQSCAVWGEQLWLYGAIDSVSGGLKEASLACVMEELHRFDFVSRFWSIAEQLGCLPDRDLSKTMHKGFHPIVTFGEAVIYLEI
jgi:hypothetical protein